MAINLSDISGFTKFIGTKFVEDISFGEEPLIDVKVMTAKYQAAKAEKAKKAADIEARKAAQKAKAKKAADFEARKAARKAKAKKQTADSTAATTESDRRY